MDEKIKAEEERKEALEALFKSLLHHLMTGKVRVARELGEVVAGNAGAFWKSHG